MKWLAMAAALALPAGCATVAPRADQTPLSTVSKTVAATPEKLEQGLTQRAAALHLTVAERSEEAGAVRLVLEGPREQHAMVSSGSNGFSTGSFVFRRVYTLRLLALDAGHTKVELGTTARFEDSDACAPQHERVRDFAMPRWAQSCSLPTATGRPNTDTVDHAERDWVLGADEDEVRGGLLAGLD